MKIHEQIGRGGRAVPAGRASDIETVWFGAERARLRSPRGGPAGRRSWPAPRAASRCGEFSPAPDQAGGGGGRARPRRTRCSTWCGSCWPSRTLAASPTMRPTRWRRPSATPLTRASRAARARHAWRTTRPFATYPLERTGRGRVSQGDAGGDARHDGLYRCRPAWATRWACPGGEPGRSWPKRAAPAARAHATCPVTRRMRMALFGFLALEKRRLLFERLIGVGGSGAEGGAGRRCPGRSRRPGLAGRRRRRRTWRRVSAHSRRGEEDGRAHHPGAEGLVGRAGMASAVQPGQRPQRRRLRVLPARARRGCRWRFSSDEADVALKGAPEGASEGVLLQYALKRLGSARAADRRSGLTLRLSAAPDLGAPKPSSRTKYASSGFHVNLGHREKPR